ncbi:MAG: N-acetylglucosaminyl-phosphatidylinositol biosynthetic protein Spt14 [Candidatus Nitrosocaldaceae archaeon]|nr:MAG: N-acetylglucosaminyl-phosphatidylinositol biosynthetic protein Spt14 [Candidatus Nitrosocaldaceae archaeon]
MHITFVVQRYYPYIGGVETHVKMISEILAKHGYVVKVFTTDPSNKLEKEDVINDVYIRRFRSFAPKEAYYIPTLEFYNAIKNHSTDIVHAHTIQAFPLLYAALAKNDRWRFVITPHYHGPATLVRSILFALYTPLIKHAIKKADKIISVSNYEQRVLISKFGVETNKIVYIPNGLNLEELTRYKRSKNDDTFNILFVGRFEKYKNAHNLILSMRLIEKHIPNYKLTLIGDGSYREYIMHLIKRLNLESRIIIKNRLSREELLLEYSKSDVFILPSLHEAYGIAAIEAIVMGIPTIVAKATALNDLVENGSAIGIDLPITPEKIAEKILQVYSNPEKPKRMKDILTWDEVVERLIYLYEELVKYQRI